MPNPKNDPPAITGPNKSTRKSAGLKAWLAFQRIRYDYRRDAWTQTLPDSPPRALGWQAVVDLVTTSAPSQYARAPSLTLAVLRTWAREEQLAFVRQLQEEMVGWIPTQAEAKRAWDIWINAVCEDGHELSKLVMQHWIWQVKRKMMRAQVTDHMCPILVGSSGSGKSIEARRLIEPVAAVADEQTLAQLVDERHYLELSRFYVIYLDEMAGAKRADRDTLKTLITSEYVSAHVFHTQRRELVYQAATLLGSSNHPVADIIHDSTSARRYWELRCRSPRLAWDALQSLDRRILWGSVDETAASPLDQQPNAKAEIQQLQHRHLRTVPPLELWAQEVNVKKGKIAVPTAALYDSYSAWCGDARVQAVSKVQFGRQLKGILRIPKTRDKKGNKAWTVNRHF